MNLIIPQGYQSALDIRETEVAIKKVKDFFEKALAANLNLTRVSAPLFVDPDSGLNDNLNGVERPVSFDILEQNGRVAEIVHSLAKWKRHALGRYGFAHGMRFAVMKKPIMYILCLSTSGTGSALSTKKNVM